MDINKAIRIIEREKDRSMTAYLAWDNPVSHRHKMKKQYDSGKSDGLGLALEILRGMV